MRPPRRRSRRALALRRTIRSRCSVWAKRGSRRARARRPAPTSSARSRSILRSTRRGTACRARARRSWPSWSAPTARPPRSPAVVASADSALESIVAALSIARDNPAYWTQFERCVKEFDLRHPVDSRVRDLLFRALGHTAVDPARLVRPIASLVATRPDAVELRRRLSRSGAADAPHWPAAKDDVRGLLGDALLQRLLEAVVVPSLFVERLVALRAPRLAGGVRDGALRRRLRCRCRPSWRWRTSATPRSTCTTKPTRRVAGVAVAARCDRGGATREQRGAASLVRAVRVLSPARTRSTTRTRSPPSSRRPRSPRSRRGRSGSRWRNGACAGRSPR